MIVQKEQIYGGNEKDNNYCYRNYPLAASAGAKSQNKYYAFSNGDEFQSVISSDGRWKLHLPHSYRSVKEYGADGEPGNYFQKSIELSLFDMENDPYENHKCNR